MASLRDKTGGASSGMTMSGMAAGTILRASTNARRTARRASARAPHEIAGHVLAPALEPGRVPSTQHLQRNHRLAPRSAPWLEGNATTGGQRQVEDRQNGEAKVELG